ncbi:MAG TPA: MBOAT family O-acyltransferase [Chitinophagaceae bacterium]|nr:MBOAT family O-acyltransferase [Chitinophagaceae bacterium]
MVFSSPIFLFYFLPSILLIYALVRGNINLQNIVLFFSSLLFYFWGEKQFAILVLFSITINYLFGYFISKTERDILKKWILGIGILSNLSLLLYFKYFNFLVSIIFNIPIENSVHLPLGVSFFTFHGLTYIIDIYRKDAIAAKSPLNVGLYILFFPQLIAGPIVRYKDIDQQLNARDHTTEKFYEGIRRFIIGLGKKIIIANSLGSIADTIYQLPSHDISPAIAWLATICYTLQIYFDFSGYSDMAIGLAKLFGFEFVENFNFPYASQSIQDFWRRWHISLSTFFRDYVYIPLGGNRKGPFRVYLNLLIVFFLTGLWHGASWNYIIWGLFHGTFLLVERLGFSTFLNKIPRFARHLYTLFVVMIGWVFFRLENLHQALDVLKKLFFINTQSTGIYTLKLYLRPDIIVALVLGILLSFPIQKFGKNILPINTSNVYKRILLDCFYIFVFLMSLSILSASTYNPFIYFRF